VRLLLRANRAFPLPIVWLVSHIHTHISIYIHMYMYIYYIYLLIYLYIYIYMGLPRAAPAPPQSRQVSDYECDFCYERIVRICTPLSSEEGTT